PSKSQAAGVRSSRWLTLMKSGPDRVGHALLGEACLGSACELLLGSRRIARLLRVALALLHEAVERRTGELFLSRLRLAGWILRKRTSDGTTRESKREPDP